MKLSLNWVSEYVTVPATVPELCDRFDLTGTGVEGVETLGAQFENIVTAQVIKKEKHPDSDHMWVCSVDVGTAHTNEQGQAEPLQIVCGAQNFNEGDHIVTALVGAELPGDIKIKKSKLRGVVSCGMNCSARELGLSNDHEGIMILPEDAPVGMPFGEYLASSDTVLDLEITPNRPDCMSVVGLAREMGAIYQVPVQYPLEADAAKLQAHEAGAPVADNVTVSIEDDSRCDRYCARVIDNVKVGPSPDWLVERITAEGARSINNVVDITNYILFLYGQPLHAFDYDRIKGESGSADIVVRAAKPGEQLETLDGQLRTLNPDMTVIATPARAIALAGVMGGANSEVEDDTTTVLLETATFSRAHTSRTSRNLSLISEASIRYERGVDAAPIQDISAAAAALIAEVAGGVVRPGCVDVYPTQPEVPNLAFRIARFNAMMGTDIPESFITDILGRLGCSVSLSSEQYDSAPVLTVVPPTFRPDLEREIDLYEEVLRLWGMDRVPSTLPASPNRVGLRTHAQSVRRVIDATLRACGLSETMTYSFASADDAAALRMEEVLPGVAVELLNPMNADHAIMRRSIFPGLMRSVAHNQAHGVRNIQLYEIGTVFSTGEDRPKPKETTKIAAVLAGAMHEAGWNNPRTAFDFYDAKGICEVLLHELAAPKIHFKPFEADDASFLQPGRAARIYSGGSELGWVGELHPLAVAAFDVEGPVAAFEFDMAALVSATRPARDYVDVPTFPAIEVDQAFVVTEDTTHERMTQVMTSAGGKMLESVTLFDVYRDDQRVGAGKKSMAYKLVYRAPDRTLTSEEVEKAHNKIITKVAGATGAEVRA